MYPNDLIGLGSLETFQLIKVKLQENLTIDSDSEEQDCQPQTDIKPLLPVKEAANVTVATPQALETHIDVVILDSDNDDDDDKLNVPLPHCSLTSTNNPQNISAERDQNTEFDDNASLASTNSFHNDQSPNRSIEPLKKENLCSESEDTSSDEDDSASTSDSTSSHNSQLPNQSNVKVKPLKKEQKFSESENDSDDDDDDDAASTSTACGDSDNKPDLITGIKTERLLPENPPSIKQEVNQIASLSSIPNCITDDSGNSTESPDDAENSGTEDQENHIGMDTLPSIDSDEPPKPDITKYQQLPRQTQIIEAQPLLKRGRKVAAEKFQSKSIPKHIKPAEYKKKLSKEETKLVRKKKLNELAVAKKKPEPDLDVRVLNRPKAKITQHNRGAFLVETPPPPPPTPVALAKKLTRPSISCVLRKNVPPLCRQAKRKLSTDVDFTTKNNSQATSGNEQWTDAKSSAEYRTGKQPKHRVSHVQTSSMYHAS